MSDCHEAQIKAAGKICGDCGGPSSVWCRRCDDTICTQCFINHSSRGAHIACAYRRGEKLVEEHLAHEAERAKLDASPARQRFLAFVAGSSYPAPIKLWLDDERLAPGDDWTHAKTVEEAIAVLRSGLVSEASLDHDLGCCEGCRRCDVRCPCKCHLTGTFLVDWMAAEGVWPAVKPRVHSANVVGAERMRATVERYFRR